MAYTRTIWSSKDIITAAKLNHLENGIADISSINESLETRANEIDNDLTQLNNTINNLESDIAANSLNITTLGTQVVPNVRSDIDRLTNNVTTLTDEDANINTRIDNIEIFSGMGTNPNPNSLTQQIADLTNDLSLFQGEQNQQLSSIIEQLQGLNNWSVNYAGAYTNGTSYTKNDIVSYEDAQQQITYYICINDTTGTSTAPQEPNWQEFIIPTQLDGLVYYGPNAPSADNKAPLWVKTQNNGTIYAEYNLMTTDDLNDIVTIRNTQPSSNLNKIWINPNDTVEEVNIPTYDDLMLDYDFIWEMEKTITATGEEQINKFTACSLYYECSPGDALKYTGAQRDSANKQLFVYIHLYNANKVWQSPRILMTTDAFIIPQNIKYFRLVFGRDSSTQINFQQSDLEDYFSFKWYRKNNTSNEFYIYSPINGMLDVAETYFTQAYGLGTHLVYDSTHGLFSPQTTSDDPGEEGHNSIVCSMFTQALLQGIRYENSRYVNANNHISSWGFTTDGTGDYIYDSTQISDPASLDYMWAKGQCHYAMEHGFAYQISTLRKQVRPGDLVFYGLGDVLSWNDITHVALVLHVGLEDNYMITLESDTWQRNGKEVGVGTKRFQINTGYSGHYQYGARYPVDPSYVQGKLLISDKDLSGINTDSFVIKQYTFAQSQEMGFYTGIIEGDLSDAVNVSFGIIYDGEDGVDYTDSRCVHNNNKYAVTFYARKPFKHIVFGKTYKVNDVLLNAPYNIKRVQFYRGYYGMDWAAR